MPLPSQQSITIAFSIRTDIVNKATESQQTLLGRGWRRAKMTLEDLADHVGKGFPFAPPMGENCECKTCQERGPARFHRVKTNWIFQQYIGLDFDTEPDYSILLDPFIATHQYLIYNTASSTPEHPKFRVVLPLAVPLNDVKFFDRLLLALKRKFTTADNACFERARAFYGSTTGQPRIVAGPVLTYTELEALTLEYGGPAGGQDFQATKHIETGLDWNGTESGLILKFEDFLAALAGLPYYMGSNKNDSYNKRLGFAGAVLALYGSHGLAAIETHWPKDSHGVKIDWQNKLRGFGSYGTIKPIATILAAFRDNGIKPHLHRVAPKYNRVVVPGVTNLIHHGESETNQGARPADPPAGPGQPPTGHALAGPTEDDIPFPTDLDNWDFEPVEMPAYGRYFLNLNLVTDRVNSRYLPAGILKDLCLKHKAIMVWSPKNSGKTEQLKQLVEAVLLAGGKVLAIGPRRALMREMCQKLGTAYYEDWKGKKAEKKGLSDQPGIGIVLDSVPTDLDTEKLAGIDLLIFDEYEQTLKHMIGDTIRGKRIHVVNSLKFFIETAKHVVCLDADMSAIGYDYLANYVKPENIRILYNEHKAGGKTFYSYETEANWNVEINRQLEQGKKLYICLNSLEKSKVLAERLSIKFPGLKIWVVNSEEASEHGAELVEQIKNIDATVQLFDVVIASPTLSTGVDIKCNHFHAVFCYGGSRPTTHKELLQQAERVRNPIDKAVHCYISPAKQEYITDPEILLGFILENMKETVKVALNTEPDSITGKRYLYRAPAEDVFNRLYLAITSDTHASLNNLKELFFEAAAKENNTVVEVEPFEETELAPVRVEIREAKEAVADRYSQAVVNAKDITEGEYQKLKAKDYKSSDEVARFNKKTLARFYGREVTPELVDLDNKGKKRKQIRAYRGARNLEYARSFDRSEANSRLEWTEANSNNKESQRVEIAPIFGPYLRFSTIGRNMALAILEAAGLRQEGDMELITNFPRYTAASLQERGFPAWLVAHAEEIQRKLGLKVKADIERNPCEFLNGVLSHFGIETKSAREKTGRHAYDKFGKVLRDKKGQIVPERIRVYEVDRASLEEMESLMLDHMQAEKERLGHNIGDETEPGQVIDPALEASELEALEDAWLDLDENGPELVALPAPPPPVPAPIPALEGEAPPLDPWLVA